MTIDEHIKGLQKRADEYWDRLCSDNLSYIGSIAQSRDNDVYTILIELIKLLEELKRYREQDLIRREDVKDISKMYFCKWDYNKCGSYSYCDQCAVLKINDIPKAEPSHHIGESTEKDSKDCNGCFGASFGDCETCRNHTLKVDDLCVECLNGANYYEPYIP